MCYPSVTPNKIQRPLHASTFVSKYDRLSRDVVGSNVDRDASIAYY